MSKYLMLIILLIPTTRCEEASPTGDTAMFCEDGPPPWGCGTAFYVGEGHWLTTSHILKEGWKAREQYLYHPEHGKMKVKLQYVNFDTDITAFTVPDPPVEFTAWEFCDYVTWGAVVFAFSEVPEYSYEIGRVSNLWDDDLRVTSRTVRLDLQSRGGYSGGPVVQRKKHCVVGMITGGYSGHDAAMIHVTELRRVVGI